MRMEPIPLNVKVILIGSPILYLLLTQDEDFQKLFKVKVDFDIEMQRTPENSASMPRLSARSARRENLKHFSQAGLARIVEYGSRLAGSQNKLSTRFNEVSEIVYEANALARPGRRRLCRAPHVDQAIPSGSYRSNRIEEKIQEMILQGKIMIETSGAVVGQSQRAFRHQPGQLYVWPAIPHHGSHLHGAGRGHQHRARDRHERQYPLQGRPDHARRLPGRKFAQDNPLEPDRADHL